MADTNELKVLSTLVGEEVVAAERCGWGFENRTDKVTLAGGRTLIVQRIANRGMAGHKIRLAQLLPERLAEVGLRAPRLLKADMSADTPFVVREYLEGEAGASRMGGVEGAVGIAEAMGAVLPQLARVRADRLGLHQGWANPTRLITQAQRQLERCREMITAEHATALAQTIAEYETLFANRPAVFAHGDFCPVNVLVKQDESKAHVVDTGPQIVALLDVEFARVADPLFDAAWWGWVVRYHHEERWVHAFPRLLAAATIADNELTRARIRTIQRLRLLEALDYNMGISPERGMMWAARLAATMGWA